MTSENKALTPARTSLYDLGRDEQALVDLLMESGGALDTPESEQAFEQWTAELERSRAATFNRLCRVIREVDASAAAAFAESRRLADLAKARANAVDAIEAKLLAYMTARDITKIETDTFRVSRRNNGGRLALALDEAAIPNSFKVPVFVPDKEAIRAKLDAGELVPGAALKPRGQHLVIQ
jgi:hypothetical protein